MPFLFYERIPRFRILGDVSACQTHAHYLTSLASPRYITMGALSDPISGISARAGARIGSAAALINQLGP